MKIISDIVSLLFRSVMDYVLPPGCILCKEMTVTEDGFCSHCWKKINLISSPYCKICGYQFSISITDNMTCGKCLSIPPDYDVARSLFIFDEYSRKIIHAFKYHDKTVMAKIFARMLYHRYKAEIMEVDIISFVPMHRLKRLFRMYNQAQLLAKELSIISNKPLCNDLLIKYRLTKSQTYMSKKARVKNISNSIKFNVKNSIHGKKILLVDDVMTTGATIQECSKLLKKNGAAKISVFTAART